MPFGRSIEEKEAARAEKERVRADRARQEAERLAAERAAAEHARYLASPVGRATMAKQDGARFFEVKLVVSTTEGSTSWISGESSATSSITHTDTLGEIEDVGWRLEHVGYVFIVTSESTRERGFSTGENVAVNGQTMGIYLFRNADA
jgi:hypothetical protein